MSEGRDTRLRVALGAIAAEWRHEAESLRSQGAVSAASYLLFCAGQLEDVLQKAETWGKGVALSR